MREILFRGRKTENGQWAYGVPTYYMGYIFGEDDLDMPDSCLVDKETIGQYTGLNDKNGTKIFEGDILYTKHGVKCEGKGYYESYHEVVFKNGAFGVIGETTGEFLSFDYLPIDNEVVCGNIYDNRNLLE